MEYGIAVAKNKANFKKAVPFIIADEENVLGVFARGQRAAKSIRAEER